MVITPAPTARRGGYVHEAAVYDSDDDLLRYVVPHLEAAVAAGEPALAALRDGEADLVRSAMADATGVTFLPAFTGDDRAPAAIKRVTSMLRDLVDAGAEQVRLVNTVPHPGLDAPWDGWCRYEAASNDLFAELPGWSLCLYDRRITTPEVLADVERTHPLIATPEGRHVPNDRYQDPTEFLRSMPSAPLDPLEAGPPAVELVDPTPAAGRHAVRDTARTTRLGREELDNLLTATSEAVTNAVIHGQPPVTVRVWAAPERVVVTVTDPGAGPQDPYVGLIPRHSAADGGGGFGLWICHQLVAATYTRGEEGFTIRLLAGRWRPPG